MSNNLSKKINILIKKSVIMTIFNIILGSICYSAGIGLFLNPNRIAPGGVMGIAMILNYVVGVETGTWFFLLNIPIVLFGWYKFGSKFIVLSFFSISINSFLTNVFQSLPVITENTLLAAVAGSVLVGTGIGWIFKSGATTGGMDIFIKALRQKYPAIKTSTFFLTIDMIVVILSGVVFSDFDIVIYALITVMLSGKVLEFVLYGKDEANLIYIVSDEPDKMVERLLAELKVGVTTLVGQGAYRKKEKRIIMCVMKKRETPKLEEIVKEEDPEAFLIISSAKEIYGQGYKNIMYEKI